MLSIQQRAQCLGLGPNFSVIGDFFGYSSVPGTVSVATQLERLANPRIDLDLIRVGMDQFTSADIQEIDVAVARMRELYAPHSLAVGRLYHSGISTADAAGYDNIGSDSEAVDLCDDWSGPNDGAMDVYLVLTYAGDTIGYSAVDGPYDQRDGGKGQMEGSVVAIEGWPDLTGFVLAHEVAHYLGLSHVEDATNLMNPTVPNGGGLSSDQGANLRDHGFVRRGC